MQNMQFSVHRTNSSVRARFNEHHRFIKNNNPKSAYAIHIVRNGHKYGILHTMELLETCEKGQRMNCWEIFHILTFQYCLNPC